MTTNKVIKVDEQPTTRKPVTEVGPGNIVWLDRKTRGVLGSRDRHVVVKTTPKQDGLPRFDSYTFDAWEWQHGTPHLISVCTGLNSTFEVVVLPPM